MDRARENAYRYAIDVSEPMVSALSSAEKYNNLDTVISEGNSGWDLAHIEIPHE